ncbi:golgin subfamily A member 2 isoform X1 [Solea senegalensis]|uniref:Golgin subfamily A member 2 isoform X1 n=2 Tax=Solea senegalensis TaxID=28829 RepID=A0AAV6R3I1_SOLSE|nr:golgin subfamily A member 2 isoform X1 [Solea senegalensis]KAG7498960.1 golgin subfamily A member 2 isoform X1 [Solea senegalensis]
MADQSRQIKLAAAKKKLKEFQQKSSPVSVGVEKGGGGGGGGASSKKKRKVKGQGQYDAPSTDRNSPINFDTILKAISQSNGVALPSYGNSQTFADVEPVGSSVPQLLEDSSPVSNPAVPNTTNITESASHNTDVQDYPDTNGNESFTEENRPLSSTESLRQLSQQLNGLVSESSAAYVNGDGAPALSERELESRNQELAAALESTTVTNSQLNTQLDQLAQQSQELTDQLQKERKEFEQRFSKEQGAMREQLQVHIQTIGILVSEKSELQTALQYTQQAARQKAADAEELNSRLQSAKQRVSELERTLSSVSSQQKHFEKHNKELEKERDALRLEVFRVNNVSDESKQQSSELSEQLKLMTRENGAMRLEVEDLRKRLEMADLMLQQCSNQSDPSSVNQQVQLLVEEKQQLETHNHQLMESFSQLKTERDCYAEQIQQEGRVWKDKTEQLLTQVSLVAEERDRNISRVQELEASITELKNNAALLSQEKDPQDNAEAQPSGPSENEIALEENLNRLQQEKEALAAQYQAQLRDNEQLSRLCAEQETRLGEMERQVESQTEEAADRRRMLEDVQSDKATISRALTQNRTLKDQLAELQNGFVQLTNENMELTTAIQSEQHVKKELARRMGELQEELHNVKEQLELKGQESQGVMAQRDQVVAHLQQYYAAYQALVSEREQLHQQYLQQCQLMDRLQHDESHGRTQLEISHGQLKQTQDRLEKLIRDNEQLKAEVRELLNSSALASSSSRDQGDGVESQSLEESPKKSPSIVIPEDFESQKEMEDFIHGALAHLEAERDEARRLLEEEHRLHMAARHQATVALSHEHQYHSHDHDHQHEHDHDHQHEHDHSQGQHSHCEHGHEHSEGGVPVEVHQALQAAMEKLQHRFTSLMQEKADLKERVEELEHRCIQLSGETDTIGEYIALYQNQRAIMKQKHQEKEQYISMLAQDKEEMKAKLAELQDLVMRLVAERNGWYSRYAGAVAGTVNPDLVPLVDDHTHLEHQAYTGMELNAVSGEEAMEVIPLSEPSTGLEASSSQAHLMGSVQTDSNPLVPKEDGTAQQIMQLLQEIQNPQGLLRSAPFLGENPCIPFFYRPDEQDEVKILVV